MSADPCLVAVRNAENVRQFTNQRCMFRFTDVCGEWVWVWVGDTLLYTCAPGEVIYGGEHAGSAVASPSGTSVEPS